MSYALVLQDITNNGCKIHLDETKRIQGSHFANLHQANQANEMMIQKLIDPLMSECFNWDQIPAAHTKMMDNKHLPGNMAALVQAKKTGMKTLNDVK